MPTPTIYEDAISRPDLFQWFGIGGAALEDWLTALPLRAHPGLVDFWRRTGGGDIFESETLLGPLATDESDNVLKVNEHHRSRGLPDQLLIFHIGLCMSASSVDQKRHRNRLVTLGPDSYRVMSTFDSFNDWYQNASRSEYASRYGL